MVNESALHRGIRLAAPPSPNYNAGMEEKIVVLHGFTPEEATELMKAVKAALPSARDAAFATTTPTNLEWKLSYLFEHVAEEHRAFKELRARQAKKS